MNRFTELHLLSSVLCGYNNPSSFLLLPVSCILHRLPSHAITDITLARPIVITSHRRGMGKTMVTERNQLCAVLGLNHCLNGQEAEYT